MNLIDRIAIDDKALIRKTSEGYLVAMPRVSRTGIQLYKGDEVGKPDMATVRIFRPEDEVFSRDSLASFGFKPLTNDHPASPVTADTWADVAIGQIGPNTARDGEFVRAEILMMDADAIKTVDAGKAELSVGYSCDIDFTAGKTVDGLIYDGIQKNIRANHLALVGMARGGDKLRIGDAETMDKVLRTIMVDGLSVETTDAGAQAISKLQADIAKIVGDASAAKTAADTQIGTLTATVATRDGEIVALKKQVADATLTPAMIDAAVSAKAAVVTDAKLIMGDDFKTDGLDAAAIRKAVVDAKLGEAAKGFAVASIDGAFAVMLKAAKDAGGQQQGDGINPTADGLRNMDSRPTVAHDKAWQESNKQTDNRWKNAGAEPRATQ